MTSDPYVYPGTNVLRNLHDLRDPDRLQLLETRSTTNRLIQLESTPLPGAFDARHLKAIHGFIFQDVYSWSGEFRTVNMSRGGQAPFAFAKHIDAAVNQTLGELRQEKCLQGLAPETFSNRAGHYLGELNAIHPFRDGNGRTQREFIRELALENGYTLDWSRVSPERMREASRMSFQRGDNAGMAELVQTALEVRDKTKERSLSSPKITPLSRLEELRERLARSDTQQQDKDHDRDRD